MLSFGRFQTAYRLRKGPVHDHVIREKYEKAVRMLAFGVDGGEDDLYSLAQPRRIPHSGVLCEYGDSVRTLLDETEDIAPNHRRPDQTVPINKFSYYDANVTRFDTLYNFLKIDRSEFRNCVRPRIAIRAFPSFVPNSVNSLVVRALPYFLGCLCVSCSYQRFLIEALCEKTKCNGRILSASASAPREFKIACLVLREMLMDPCVWIFNDDLKADNGRDMSLRENIDLNVWIRRNHLRRSPPFVKYEGYGLHGKSVVYAKECDLARAAIDGRNIYETIQEIVEDKVKDDLERFRRVFYTNVPITLDTFLYGSPRSLPQLPARFAPPRPVSRYNDDSDDDP